MCSGGRSDAQLVSHWPHVGFVVVRRSIERNASTQPTYLRPDHSLDPFFLSSFSFPFLLATRSYEPSPLSVYPFYRVHTDIAINARPPNNEFVFRFIRFSSCLRREIDSSSAYFDRVQFVLVKVLVVEIRQPIGFASLLQRSKSNYLNLLDDLQINRIRIIFNFPNNLFNEISFRANLII